MLDAIAMQTTIDEIQNSYGRGLLNRAEKLHMMITAVDAHCQAYIKERTELPVNEGEMSRSPTQYEMACNQLSALRRVESFKSKLNLYVD